MFVIVLFIFFKDIWNLFDKFTTYFRREKIWIVIYSIEILNEIQYEPFIFVEKSNVPIIT